MVPAHSEYSVDDCPLFFPMLLDLQESADSTQLSLEGAAGGQKGH